MEESQESKDVIISLPVLMNMPEEAICELFRTEKTRPAISVGLRLFMWRMLLKNLWEHHLRNKRE